MAITLSWNPEMTRAALVFSHPKGNIITEQIVAELQAAVDDVARSPHLRLLTFEGAGSDFSFGASVPEHAPGEIERVLPAMHALIMAILDMPAPTAAVVRGQCLGGGFELALACDFIFAADSATFGLPEIALGVFPPAGSVLLPWRAGGACATSAVLTGRSGSAAAWQQAGVIEMVVPEGDLAEGVDTWFDETLARWSAEGLRQAVQAVRAPIVRATRRDLPIIERLYLHHALKSHDAIEGVQAFLEKRAPSWRDH